MHKNLIKLDPENNNNRFCTMEIDANGKLIVTVGRVGARGVPTTYPAKLFDKLYQKKLTEGFVDRTKYTQATVVEKFKPIDDGKVAALWSYLCKAAKKHLERTCLSYDSVTEKMIEDAKGLLTSLNGGLTVDDFNEELIKLFGIIPRKSSNLALELASSIKDYDKILEREWELIDVLEPQVKHRTINAPKQTQLEALNLSITSCTDEEIDNIKSHLSMRTLNSFINAYKVDNGKPIIREGERYFLYHGSRNANWYGLITEGNKLHPNAVITGKMFGEGIYFAPQSKKSQGYTDAGGVWTKSNKGKGFIGIYEIYLKNPKYIDTWHHSCTHYPKGLNGYDSVWAKAGTSLLHDEVIVYSEKQAKLKYLIEIGG